MRSQRQPHCGLQLPCNASGGTARNRTEDSSLQKTCVTNYATAPWRLKMDRICEFCETPFLADPREVNRGGGRFCSRSCSSRRQRPPESLKRVTLTCAYCQTTFERRPSKMASSKSGLYFCCREHKDLAQRLGGLPEIQPPHYGTGCGKNDYRERALAHYGPQCSECGWDEIEEVLDVHHLDLDRSNNELNNLRVYCPTHHVKWHYLNKSGRFATHKPR